ncbi:hypothetical protein [Alphaproteobacteria bacterium endosymbiont of Tiliacea citrago]|uniref:hypothetical protein n=1 Tax=Alphaproteobacteria bacterium endosymbiont of Tiliacea citrago TaxID=3077944 RepID=UPI00313DE75D
MKNKIKNFLLTFLIIATIEIKTKKDRSKENKIINGHNLDELEEGDIYVGQSESEVLNILGKPLIIPGQTNTLYYFKSVRSIYPVFPLRGKIKSGTLLIIELDEQRKIISFKKQEYHAYKTSKSIEKRLKELIEKRKQIEKNQKEFVQKNDEKQIERIEKAKKSKIKPKK